MAADITTSENWARTYRPRRFSDIAGQEATVSRLRGMLKRGKVPGFLLFVGPSGCGKTTLARLFSRYLNCEKGTACGKCPSCLHDPDNHPDVEELNAATQRGIDEVRSLIAKARFHARYKVRVFLIDEAHQLTPQAAQAFLKPLEDVAKGCLYIVCTTDPDKMPAAMLTRAQTLAITMPTKKELTNRLQVIADAEELKVSKELMSGIIEYSGGSVRQAVNLLEGAAQLLADDPKAKPEAVLVKLGVAESPENQLVAMKLVLAMHMGNRKAIVRAVLDAQEPVPMINLALRYNEYAIGRMTIEQHPQLWPTQDNRKFWSLLEEKVEKPSVVKAAEIERALTDVRNSLVTVSTQARSILLGRLL